LLIETVTDRCCSNEEHLPQILKHTDPRVGVCLDIPHIIEYRVKRWKVIHDPLTIVNDLPPLILERTMVVHIHGVHILGRRATLTHTLPNKDFLRKIMYAIRSHIPSARIGVLEIFKDNKGRNIKIHELRWVVNYVRKR